MKIVILAVGRTSTPYIADAVADYVRRASHYVPVEMTVTADIRGRSLTPERQCESEGELILRQLNPADRVVLLDERGKELTSRAFADSINAEMLGGRGRIVYVIGGPYGFSEAVRRRADAELSLSRMTFTHEMVRLFFAEQVYRAMTIIRGEKYHHE